MSGPRPLVDEKAAVRAVVFGHLAGIAVAPVMKALLDRGVFDLFRGDSHWVEFDRILEHSRGNHGHLRVALRLLSSYGWLRTEVDRGAPLYSVTPGGVIAARKASHLYGAVVPFLRLAIFLDDFLFGHGEGSLLPYLESLVPQALGRWGLQVEEDAASAPVWEQIRTQLDGVLIGPAMVALERGGAFDSSSMVLGPWRASQVILPACLCFSTFSAFLAG